MLGEWGSNFITQLHSKVNLVAAARGGQEVHAVAIPKGTAPFNNGGDIYRRLHSAYNDTSKITPHKFKSITRF